MPTPCRKVRGGPVIGAEGATARLGRGIVRALAIPRAATPKAEFILSILINNTILSKDKQNFGNKPRRLVETYIP